MGGHRNICGAASMSSIISKADFDALILATQLGDITRMKLILLEKNTNLIRFDEVNSLLFELFVLKWAVLPRI